MIKWRKYICIYFYSPLKSNNLGHILTFSWTKWLTENNGRFICAVKKITSCSPDGISQKTYSMTPYPPKNHDKIRKCVFSGHTLTSVCSNCNVWQPLSFSGSSLPLRSRSQTNALFSYHCSLPDFTSYVNALPITATHLGTNAKGAGENYIMPQPGALLDLCL